MADQILTISAAEANWQFSKLLRAARDGQRVTITSHGQPVAELGPVSTNDLRTEQRRQAHQARITHLADAKPVDIEAWTRDELYERE